MDKGLAIIWKTRNKLNFEQHPILAKYILAKAIQMSRNYISNQISSPLQETITYLGTHHPSHWMPPPPSNLK